MEAGATAAADAMTLAALQHADPHGRAVRAAHAGTGALYTCGPTVYNSAHIGNFRTFLFEDLLRRWLEAQRLRRVPGHEPHRRGRQDHQGGPPRGPADPRATRAATSTPSIEDRDYLRIARREVYPRATEFIPEMVGWCERLIERGRRLPGDDGSVYFAIARFPGYGRLSRLDTRELKAGASERVSADDYAKEDARDFALWKAARAGGRGGRARRGTRPGAAAGRAGTSSARPWRWSCWGRSGRGRSTSMPAAST